MSGEESFLSRWARRKQAVKEKPSSSPHWGEAESERSSEPGEGAALNMEALSPHPLGSRRVGLSPEGRGGEPAFNAGDQAATHGGGGPPSEPVEPLPEIKDIDATSDISGFLRKGVPEAVRQAALRRVWALDPAIRDFVSPAEYAWDFNDPNSIPGFASSVGTMDLTGFFSGETPSEPPVTSLAQAVAPGEGAAAKTAATSQERALAAVPSDTSPSPSSEESEESTAVAENSAEQLYYTLPRRHGGAFPQ